MSAAVYLGVTLQENFKFSIHIQNIVKKCNSLLFLLRRNLKHAPKLAKKVAYTSLVRSRLEYASAAWDRHYKKDIDLCEAVNNRGARFIARNYSRYSSVTAIKRKQELETLASRRAEHARNLFAKYARREIAIPNGPVITDGSLIRWGPGMSLMITKNLFFHKISEVSVIAYRQNPWTVPSAFDPG